MAERVVVVDGLIGLLDETNSEKFEGYCYRRSQCELHMNLTGRARKEHHLEVASVSHGNRSAKQKAES